MKKRGQAAMEFLMTYGWALVIGVIAIIALVAFGVVSPAKFLPENCNLGPGFACRDFKISGDTKSISLNVVNGIGKNLDIFGIAVKKENLGTLELCGGFVGFVSLPGSDDIRYFPTFADGEIRAIGYRFPSHNATQGINCIAINTYKQNCCAHNQMKINYYDTGTLPNLCPGVPLPSNNACNPNVLTSDKSGKRFNEDLMVFYRADGSSIVHVREGSLSGLIE